MKENDTTLPMTDPVIQEVRRHKQAIAEEFGFDVVALGKSLQQRQASDPLFTNAKAGDSDAGDHDDGHRSFDFLSTNASDDDINRLRWASASASAAPV